MTTPTVEPFARTGRIFNRFFAFFRHTEGMSAFQHTDDGMGFFAYTCMAFKTDIDRFTLQKGKIIRAMRLMAAQAHASGNRGVDILPAEVGLLMAVIAQVRRFLKQELFMVGLVGCMALCAEADADRRMKGFPEELLFIMAAITEVRQLGEKQFWNIRRMRIMAVCAESAHDRGMHGLFALKRFLFMAAIAKLRGHG